MCIVQKIKIEKCQLVVTLNSRQILITSSLILSITLLETCVLFNFYIECIVYKYYCIGDDEKDERVFD